jgi:hypothetical protein
MKFDVWDSPPGAGRVSFTTACIGHDLCWSTCAGKGNFDTHRKRCDNAFLSDMRAACIATYGSSLNWINIAIPFPNPLRRCLAAAQGYYVAVASPFARYCDAQLEYCEICP